jgi:hypothetical protein
MEWQPIDTAPKAKQARMLRPHVIYGPMSVCYHEQPICGQFHWTSVGYNPAWPEDAFLPYWMPLPEGPGQASGISCECEEDATEGTGICYDCGLTRTER